MSVWSALAASPKYKLNFIERDEIERSGYRKAILQCHSEDYLNYLETAFERW